MKSQLIIMFMFIALMLGTVYIVGTTLYDETHTEYRSSINSQSEGSIPSERSVFTRADKAFIHIEMPEGDKSLSTYYKNRAYPGAPPTIPHPLLSMKGIGAEACLQCHQNGGYSNMFKAYAPITPHPELINCVQCHVGSMTELTFKKSDWLKIAPPSISQVPMPGAPPQIPHDLFMRSNCLSCHSGPSAPKEIRVSHPERINCRQCHVPAGTEGLFIKPDVDKLIFKRSMSSFGLESQKLNDDEVDKISNWVKAKNID